MTCHDKNEGKGKAKTDDTLQKSALTFSADFSYQMRFGTKKSAPKINMDDAKIDDAAALL